MSALLKNKDNRPLLWLFTPLLVVVLAGYVIINNKESYTSEIFAFSLMTIAIVALVLAFAKGGFKKAIYILGYFFLAFFAFVKLSFYLQYGVGISASALFVIFETNTGEASDYLSNYFSLPTIIIGIILLVPLFFLLKSKLHKNTVALKSIGGRQLIATVILIGIATASVYLIRKNFRTVNIPYATLSTWKEYKIAKQNLKDNLAQPTSPAFTDVASDETPQTYVVVIGESTSSWHMQLYGYPRETNPKLTEIRNELIVLDSVITPHVHTITALDKILTRSNAQTINPNPNGSIIQLANMAGFETYWLSNQKPVGLYESIPTILGSAAKHTQFLATDDYNAQILDEDLLPKLEQILAKKEISKKIIFLHLIGTHLRYEKRYPAAYNIFTDAPPRLTYAHAKAIQQTNAYDNAVRYNDAVIRDVIELLRKENSTSSMVYFSDHGDEVYDTMDFLGHNEYHNTPPMYEVPFVLWFSEKYKTNKNFNVKQQRKEVYNLENFIHTFAQLSAIQFKGYNPSKSLLEHVETEISDTINE